MMHKAFAKASERAASMIVAPKVAPSSSSQRLIVPRSIRKPSRPLTSSWR